MLKLSLAPAVWILTLAAFPGTPALGQSQMVLSLAGESYDGPPQFEVRMGGKLVSAGALTNALDTRTEGRFYASAQPQSYVQDFVIDLGETRFSADADIVLSLTNDKFRAEGLGFDRNLFVNFVEVNGKRVWARDLLLLDADGRQDVIDYQSGFLPLYDGKHTVVARAPIDGWPEIGETPSIERSATQPSAIPLPQIRKDVAPEAGDGKPLGGRPNA